MTMQLSTAQLIKHYRELAGLNQSELARRVGISPQAVQHWEQHNSVPRPRLLPILARVLGVDVADLGHGAPLRAYRDAAVDPTVEPVSNPQLLPRRRAIDLSSRAADSPKELEAPVDKFGRLDLVAATNIAASPTKVMITHLPQQKSEEVPDVEMIVVSPTWVARHLPGRNPADIAVLEAYGDAHAPTLQHGDWLLVDTGRKGVDFDAVWVLRHRTTGELWVRRVHRRIDGGWTLLCDNPTYEPREVAPEERRHFDVVGQACRRVNFAAM